ncbi:MAG: creatininase family protein [Armatimonadetes bacterium]|nr:creatininase family protein [Armatimonadota bacterium]
MCGILEEMTITEVQALRPHVAVIPVGSTEPHGPALPYGTDSYRVEGICYPAVCRAVAEGARVICLPPLRISLNNNFRAFPFACRMSVPSFMSVLGDLVEFLEADGVRRIVIVNGHGGNPEAIQATLRHLARRDGAFLCLLSAEQCAAAEARSVIEHGSPHAGEMESSEMLHLRGELVHAERLGDAPVVPPEFDALAEVGAWYVRPWHLFMPESRGGEARGSTAEKGRVLVEAAVAGLAEFLVKLSGAAERAGWPWG